MEETQTFVVNGYCFDSKEEYEDALREKKGILYLNEQTDLNDMNRVLALYKELIEKKVFVTPVGLDYLKQLRMALIKTSGINKSDVPYVYVVGAAAKDKEKSQKTAEIKFAQINKQLSEEAQQAKHKLKISRIFCIILIAVVIAMFGISLTTSNANILNYERVIQDKYASWAQELTDKENALKNRERQIEKREKELGINTDSEDGQN